MSTEADLIRLRDAVTALLPALRKGGRCIVCDSEDHGHGEDCPVDALETAYARVSPKVSHPDGHDAAWCGCAACYRWRASLAPKSPADEMIPSGRRYFVHDGDGYDSSYTSPDEARKAAENAIDRWKADARDNDGWADEVTAVAWGEVIERAEAVPDEHAEDDEERGVDYRLTNCRVPVAPKES